MPWVDKLSEPQELRRCIRDLVALSTLPAIWKDYNSRQIADSAAAALLSMLNADVIYVSVPGLGNEAAAEVMRVSQALIVPNSPNSGSAARMSVSPSGREIASITPSMHIA